MTTMRAKAMLVAAVTAAAVISAAAASRIVMDSEGGYSGIVIRIEDDVPEEHCPEILHNIKSLLDSASGLLLSTTSGRAFFRSASVVVPSGWRDAACRRSMRTPAPDTPFAIADVIVHKSGNEKHIRARQSSSQCGHAGDAIDVNYNVLVSDGGEVDSKGDEHSRVLAKLFVREWAKFRYGVFDEHGFSGDLMYPAHFVRDGRVLPTGTTDVLAAKGTWVDADSGDAGCDPRNAAKRCVFRVAQDNNAGVTCSLGYLHFLANVTGYCDPSITSRLPMAPTKHNVLCAGKSSLDVILSHADFAHVTTGKSRKPEEVTLNIVRKPLSKYVLALETSQAMNKMERWKWINKATQKLIRYDLPVDANMAIVTFGVSGGNGSASASTARVEHSMVQVSGNEVRARLADTIPDKYHLSKSSPASAPSSGCVSCALKKVVHEVLAAESLSGTHVIVVTRMAFDRSTQHDLDLVRRLVVDSNIKLSVVLIPDVSSSPLLLTSKPISASILAAYDSLTQSTGGKTHFLSSPSSGGGDSMDFFLSLNDALSDVLRSDAPYPTEIAEVVHRQEFHAGSAGASSGGSFVLDASLGRDTLFGIYVEDQEEHRIRSVTFTDSKGVTFGPFLRLSSSFDLVNFKTINFPSGQAPPFHALQHSGSTWHYSIEWFQPSSPSPLSTASLTKTVVVVTSKPRSQRSSDVIAVRAWTNHDDSDEANDVGSSSFHPLALFVEVTRGGEPVIGAKVEAIITIDKAFEQGDEPKLVISPIELVDDGFADPDLVSGDGVYSRYVTRYLSSGRYTFSITVDDNSGNAFVARTILETNRTQLKEDLLEVPACCGSSVVLAADSVEKLGPFRRSIVGPAVVLKQVPDQGRDVLPPGRIGDLRITPIPSANSRNSNMLLATWTAPGGDFYDGAVASYRFVYSRDIGRLLRSGQDARHEPDVLIGFDRTDAVGTKSAVDIEFPVTGADFYVAAFAFDAAGNRGAVSNLVHVRIESLEPSFLQKSLEQQRQQELRDGNGKDLNWIIVGVVSGVVGVLLLVSLTAIIYYVVLTRRRRSCAGGSTGHSTAKGSINGNGPSSCSDETDSSSFDSDIKNIMMSKPLGPVLSSLTVKPTHQQLLQTSLYPGLHLSSNGHGHGQCSSSSSAADSGVAGSSNADPHTASASVTPVYWSASQLLSKLDSSGHRSRSQQPYDAYSLVNGYHGHYGQQSVPVGPHSLQVGAGGKHSGPASLGPASLGPAFGGASPVGNGSRWSGPRSVGIPEEYTITVGALCQLETESAVDDSDGSPYKGKVPPPVMPKPRNITQV